MRRLALPAVVVLALLTACGDVEPDGGASPPPSPVTTSGALDDLDEGAPATVIDVRDGVRFYPACGNETLDVDGVTWYQVQPFEFPDLHDRIVRAPREPAAGSAAAAGLVARVVEPGPGDDVGTLVVWSDGVAYFVSDSGDLDAWLVLDELRYDWDC